MFYCESCETKNGWPSSMVKSAGKCEVCGEFARCNDVAFMYLEKRMPSRLPPALPGMGNVWDDVFKDNPSVRVTHFDLKEEMQSDVPLSIAVGM